MREHKGNRPRGGHRLEYMVSKMQGSVSAMTSGVRFEMTSNREVTVEGCRGILQYDENIIRLNTGKMVTSFCGRGLAIKCLTPDSLIVEGFITSIEFIT